MITTFVPGTHAYRAPSDGSIIVGDRDPRWWQPGSPFYRHALAHGVRMMPGARPYTWTTGVDGLDDHHTVWRVCGETLYERYIPSVCPDRQVSGAETSILTHSHGLQGVLYAASFGLKIAVLISVTSPVRRDMRRIAERARPNIGTWIHLHSDWSDWWQILGSIGDGEFRLSRRHPLADQNIKIPNAGHSRLLEDPSYFPLWVERGWLARLRGTNV